MKNEMGKRSRRSDLLDTLRIARKREGETVSMMRRLLEAESPSSNKAAVDACMEIAASACRKAGGAVRRHRQTRFGDLLEARFGFGRQIVEATGGPILLLGHLDTVWPLGTLKKMPFRRKNGRFFGPGVLDMKAGVAMALTGIAILREQKLLARPIILLLNSDEEIGSPVSRPITERLARECAAVYVLEPGQGLQGAYKTARKGTGDYTVRVRGVAAHAGVDFSNGASAVLELARQIDALAEFTDLAQGVTVNPGVIGGGTQANVVAAEAWTHVDFRYLRAADAKKLERKFHSLRPNDQRCSLEVSGGVNRPPMERTQGTAALFAKAATLASELGFTLQEAATGGGSDGNFTSAIGVPTLDGMGAVGEGAHASNESILIEHLASRTALLAAMMSKE
jgi:glutamate carboxypeptidase